MKKIKVSIIGAAGYTGAELIRLLMQHPNAELVSAVSQSQVGKKLHLTFPDLISETDLCFVSESHASADVVFLCLPHGEAKEYLIEHPELLEKKIIDLSRDFRLAKANEQNGKTFVYGLPELNKEQIQKADYIANPGCFATAIQLGLLPLAEKDLLRSAIHVTGTTGSTGAGIKVTETTHFSWRQNNASVYNAFEHPHNEEILESISSMQKSFENELLFIPMRGSFTRGILATITVECELSQEEVYALFEEHYENDFFVSVLKESIHLKMVVNTNKCFIELKKHKNHLLITVVIDNLIKGASGQAIQNMNLMLGLEETTGLKLKSVTY